MLPSRRIAPTTAAAKVAVVIPCRDEAEHIGRVVADFRAALADAEIVVVDNASRDDTARRASDAGARVVFEPRPGKGNALVRGIESVPDADFVVMVDGDDTYPAERVHDLLAAARCGADMVVGTRLADAAPEAFRSGHDLGNRLFARLAGTLFGVQTTDLLSGYRVLSRRLLRTLPLLASGFEVETELTARTAVAGLVVSEVAVAYRARPHGSRSKLNTWRDGYRILIALLTYFRDYRPLACFGSLAAGFGLAALGFGSLVISDFLATGLVHRLPLAVLASALFILSALSLVCGIVLSSINRHAAELAALSRDR